MLTQIALGLYFFVTGIWTLQGGNGNEIAAAVKSVTGRDRHASDKYYIFEGRLRLLVVKVRLTNSD